MVWWLTRRAVTRLGVWPVRTWDALVPRVLGRALAHEIGHYELRRGHANTGLMVHAFHPNEVTFGPTSWYRLKPSQQSALQLRCPLHASSTLAVSRSSGPDTQQ